MSAESSQGGSKQIESRFGDDEIFYGSVPVALSVAPGHCEVYDHKQATLATSEEEVAVSVARASKLSVGGVNNAVVPCMPCVDIRQPQPANKDVSAWPKLLQQPLIKVPLLSVDAVPGTKAVASGCRSCLVKVDDGQWFRLKGSGNNDEGFILREDKALGIVQIRGCAFNHTAARENFMTTKLSAELAGCAVAANDALGSFVYDKPHQPLGSEPTADGVSVVPNCIVQRTRGDRRLGSHLLAGLTILLPQFLESVPDIKALKSVFPQSRPVDPVDSLPITTAALMTDHSLGVMYGVGDGLSFPMPRNADVFAKVESFSLAEHAPPLSNAQPRVESSGNVVHDGALTQISNNGIENAPPEWCRLWDESVEALKADLARLHAGGGAVGSTLVYLYNRIGFDCGRFARGLHKVSHVSWGTYSDAMCYDGQLHCNAHANNMVVLAPQDGKNKAAQAPDQFLAFLDLDMAFGTDDFLDTWGTKKVGKSKEEFDDLLKKENVNFMEVLVGADANLGVPVTAQAYVRGFSDEVKLLQSILYDALMLGYRRAYFDDEDCFLAPFDEAQHTLSYHFIRLALIKMANFVA